MSIQGEGFNDQGACVVAEALSERWQNSSLFVHHPYLISLSGVVLEGVKISESRGPDYLEDISAEPVGMPLDQRTTLAGQTSREKHDVFNFVVNEVYMRRRGEVMLARYMQRSRSETREPQVIVQEVCRQAGAMVVLSGNFDPARQDDLFQLINRLGLAMRLEECFRNTAGG